MIDFLSYRIAVLIDAENISYKYLPYVLKEVGRHGQIVLRAVYGDWQKPNLQKWGEIAVENDFKIRHQTNAAQTKNATDMKLIMDAMEILYRTSVDVFCLVTNDADYVPLCDKIHEAKKYVIGVGYKNAAETLIRACDQFNFIPNGKVEEVQPQIPDVSPIPAISDNAPEQSTIPQPKIRKLLSKAFAQVSQDKHDWVGLSALGTALSQVQIGFKTEDYGHATLSKLLQSMPDFVELKGESSTISARLKSTNSAAQLTDKQLGKLLAKAFAEVSDNDDGWITLAVLGTALRRVQEGFKPNQYGHANLSKLLKTIPDVVEIRTKSGVHSARLKNRIS